MNLFARLLLVAGFCLFCLSALSAQLAVGDGIPAFTAKDQFGKEFSSTNSIRFLLVAMEMGCAKSANLKLAELGAGFLETNGAVFVLDIHTMPAVARFFAFPKMRKYPHRIVLVDSATALAAFPVQPGRVTVLALTPSGIIRKISYWEAGREPATAVFH